LLTGALLLVGHKAEFVRKVKESPLLPAFKLVDDSVADEVFHAALSFVRLTGFRL
jgi:hypothetical protein